MTRDYIHDALAAALQEMIDVYGSNDAGAFEAIERAKRTLKDAGYATDWPELPADYKRRIISAPYVDVEPLAQRQRRADQTTDDFADRKEAARAAAKAIREMSPWTQTAEGYEFWSSVAARLEQVAETGDHTQ